MTRCRCVDASAARAADGWRCTRCSRLVERVRQVACAWGAGPETSAIAVRFGVAGETDDTVPGADSCPGRPWTATSSGSLLGEGISHVPTYRVDQDGRLVGEFSTPGAAATAIVVDRGRRHRDFERACAAVGAGTARLAS